MRPRSFSPSSLSPMPMLFYAFVELSSFIPHTEAEELPWLAYVQSSASLFWPFHVTTLYPYSKLDTAFLSQCISVLCYSKTFHSGIPFCSSSTMVAVETLCIYCVLSFKEHVLLCVASTSQRSVKSNCCCSMPPLPLSDLYKGYG